MPHAKLQVAREALLSIDNVNVLYYTYQQLCSALNTT